MKGAQGYSMEDKLETNIINSVERVLRYLIPGVVFCLLFALSYTTNFDKVFSKISGSGIAVFLVILTAGMSIYVVHSHIIRFTLELIAYKIGISPVNEFSNDKCLCNYSKSHAELIFNRNKSPDYPSGYYIYLWSIIHYSFIMSYLLIFFGFAHDKESWVESNAQLLAIVGVGLLILSICSYMYMQALEKDTTAKMKSIENASNKSEK